MLLIIPTWPMVCAEGFFEVFTLSPRPRLNAFEINLVNQF
jgi:hypothetical protein